MIKEVLVSDSGWMWQLRKSRWRSGEWCGYLVTVFGHILNVLSKNRWFSNLCVCVCMRVCTTMALHTVSPTWMCHQHTHTRTPTHIHTKHKNNTKIHHARRDGTTDSITNVMWCILKHFVSRNTHTHTTHKKHQNTSALSAIFCSNCATDIVKLLMVSFRASFSCLNGCWSACKWEVSEKMYIIYKYSYP